jgi:hypothetical protein
MRERSIGGRRGGFGEGLLGLVLWLGACSLDGGKRPERAEGTDVPTASAYDIGVATRGACTDWTTRTCAIELSTQGGFVDCAPGVQVCEQGVWGPCAIDATRAHVRVPAPAASSVSGSASGPRLGLQSIGGTATSCAGNVCNPSCRVFQDEPSVAVAAQRVDAPTGNLYGGALQASNVPSAFKAKGSLDTQCSAAPGSEESNSACQFDQRCVDGECVAFDPGESGICEGIDLTAPTSCVPSSGGTRAITVCNRGTETAPPGVKCYRYPGGSPKYPNPDPGLGTWVMTTAHELEPGDCETQQVAEAIWGQNGIQSVACNPPETAELTATVGPQYPDGASHSSGSIEWTSPGAANDADGASASATPPNPAAATTGPLAPSSSTSFGLDLPWNDAANAYSASPAGSYATASPAAPSVSSGSLGPNHPAAFSMPAVAGDGNFTNPERASVADSFYASATPANPGTTRSAQPSANNGSASWNNLNLAYLSGTPALYATAMRSSAGSSDGELSGFGFDVPSGAVLDSLQLSVKWKTDLHHSKYTLSAQVLTGTANTAIGSALLKSGTYTTETTDTLTVSAATLAAFGVDDFDNGLLKVRLRFQRSNGSVANSTASVDSVQLTLVYHVPNTAASVVYRNFGLDSVPDAASVQLTASVKWKTSAVNAFFRLGLQVYSDYGSASPTAIGSELVRVAGDTLDHIDSTAPLTLNGAMLDDDSFGIRIRALRNHGPVNPDVTASIDYVRVSLTWTTAGVTTTHSLFLGNFGFDTRIPSNATITSLTTAVTWKLSAPNTHATLGLQAYTDAGGVPLGSEVTNASGPTSDTTAQQIVLGGVEVADLSDANFGVRVRISRDGSSVGNPDVTASLDHVSVTVAWTAPSTTHAVSYGDFGLDGLPAGAVVRELKTEVRWHTTTATSRAALGFQPYVGATALGSEYIDGNAPTIATTRTQTLGDLSLGAAELADGNLTVKLRVTRSSGSSNPNFTALVDFVRVTATYDVTEQVSLGECNDSNNWTATKLVPNPDPCQDMSVPEYVPFTFTRVFQALCSSGGPVWRHFEYNASTPADTDIAFRFRAFPAAADGTCSARPAISSGDPEPLATVSLSGDPQVCMLGSTSSGCPVDLFAALGEAVAIQECLQMDAHGTPSESASPELLDWNVLHDCVSDE